MMMERDTEKERKDKNDRKIKYNINIFMLFMKHQKYT